MKKTIICISFVFFELVTMNIPFCQNDLDAAVSIKPGSEHEVLVSIYTNHINKSEYPLAQLYVRKTGIFHMYHDGVIDASFLKHDTLYNFKYIIIEINFDRMYLIDIKSPHSILISRSNHSVLGCTTIIKIPISELGHIHYNALSITLSEIIIYLFGILLVIITLISLIFRRFMIALIIISLEFPLFFAIIIIKMWQFG